MAEKAGYWDVHRCAWVDAEPTHVVPPTRPEATVASADPAAPVPEQRGSAEPAVTVDAPD
jgi:hypothetical protein